MLNIAHRGASGRFPENTLSAFRAAIEAGADMCELDVRLSRDGVMVVIHDDTVDRTTNGSGTVARMTFDELRRLSAGARFGSEFNDQKIPTLDDVFAVMNGRCGLNIELKAFGVERHVCEAIRSHGAFATSIVSAFDWDALRHIHYMEPAIRIGLLASRWPARLLAAATEIEAYSIHPRHDLVTEDLCIAAHQRGLSVYTWTVDDPAVMRRLIAEGVDGIMTNYPDRLRSVTGR